MLALSTVALIVFHELAVRTGVVTGKGLMRLVRERYGHRRTQIALTALVVANVGTICAEFAGVAAGMELLTGTSRYVTVPIAAAAVSVLVLKGSFRRVEHVLLALSAIFVTYIVSGFLAHPDWGATAHGLVAGGMPLTRHGVLVTVATVGTTLAPWGLAFIQSYAVDKRIGVDDLRYERIDVVARRGADRGHRAVHRRRLRGDAARRAASTSTTRATPPPRCSPLAGDAAHDAVRPRARRRRRCWPRRSSRCRRPTRSRRRSADPPTSTTASATRRCSTAPTARAHSSPSRSC